MRGAFDFRLISDTLQRTFYQCYTPGLYTKPVHSALHSFLCTSKTNPISLGQSLSCFVVEKVPPASQHVSISLGNLCCSRFEIYCRKKKRADGSVPPLDNNVSGAAAVYRYSRAVIVTDRVFAEGYSKSKRTAVCDREDTSYPLGMYRRYICCVLYVAVIMHVVYCICQTVLHPVTRSA